MNCENFRVYVNYSPNIRKWQWKENNYLMISHAILQNWTIIKIKRENYSDNDYITYIFNLEIHKIDLFNI